MVDKARLGGLCQGRPTIGGLEMLRVFLDLLQAAVARTMTSRKPWHRYYLILSFCFQLLDLGVIYPVDAVYWTGIDRFLN